MPETLPVVWEDRCPVLHQSEYVDPLEARDSDMAIGVTNSQGVIIAIGEEMKSGEWIRMDCGDPTARYPTRE